MMSWGGGAMLSHVLAGERSCLLAPVDLAGVVWDFIWGVSSSLLGAWVFDTTGVV